MIINPSSIWNLLQKRVEELSEDEWFIRPDRFPDEKQFYELIEVAFQASLMTEEKRRPGFRLLFCNPRDVHSNLEEQGIGDRIRAIPIPPSRSFSPSELNRIAPAADLTRFLVCVSANTKNNKLKIWGLLDVGDNWWKFVHHETSSGMPPPNFLAVTSTSPGELSFSLQGTILFLLKNGELSQPLPNPIWSGPICEYLESPRKQLYSEVIQELKSKKFDEGPDDDYPGRAYNYFLERVLYNIRNIGHGGSIVIVPNEFESDDSRLTDRVLLKYRTNFDYAWRCLINHLATHRIYYDNYFSRLEEKQETAEEISGKLDMLRTRKDDIETELNDISKSIASFASVDGALVVTTKFRIVGFGGEIIAASPSLKAVTEASDRRKKISIESFGTRHRSAFRFCSTLEDSIAFIVSSDGGVKAAKRQGKDLLFWPDINEGAMGL